jgi:hypothetical protein
MSEQLELFGEPTKLTAIPPCGRGLGPCLVFDEAGQLRCVTCGCVGRRKNENARTIFDGFIKSQLKFMEFLREQENAPGDPGNTE